MMCCGMKPILNTAMGKEFYVCTECKKEVKEEEQMELPYKNAFNLYPSDWSVTIDKGDKK